jgi:hypothetical protein
MCRYKRPTAPRRHGTAVGPSGHIFDPATRPLALRRYAPLSDRPSTTSQVQLFLPQRPWPRRYQLRESYLFPHSAFLSFHPRSYYPRHRRGLSDTSTPVEAFASEGRLLHHSKSRLTPNHLDTQPNSRKSKRVALVEVVGVARSSLFPYPKSKYVQNAKMISTTRLRYMQVARFNRSKL